MLFQILLQLLKTADNNDSEQRKQEYQSFIENLRTILYCCAEINNETFWFFESDEGGLCAPILALVHIAEKEEELDPSQKKNYHILG